MPYRPTRPSKRERQARHAFMSGDLSLMPAPAKPRKGGKQREGLYNKLVSKWATLRQDISIWRNRRRMVEMQPGVKIVWGWGPTGASDWAGGKSLVIQPHHVGQTICQLLVIEVKTDTGKASEAQTDFILEIHRMGGLAGVARNAEDCEAIAGGDRTRVK